MLRMGRDIVEDEGWEKEEADDEDAEAEEAIFWRGGAVFRRTMGPQRFYGRTAPTPSRNTRQGVAARRQGGTEDAYES
jgi:hypothetical protein